MRLKSLDRLRGHPLLSLITSERGPFRALKMRPVRQEAVHSLWSRLFCGPLKMRRVPEEAVFGTEFLRKRLPCRKRGFSCTEYPFRTGTECQILRQVVTAAEPGVHFSRPRISTAASALLNNNCYFCVAKTQAQEYEN